MIIILLKLATIFFFERHELSPPPLKYSCRTAQLHIETANRFMNVVADNYQVYSEINPISGEVTFKGLMKSFEFEMGVLDQAFNSSKIDLSQYSKFSYEGKLTKLKTINFNQPGTYKVTVNGFLYIGSYKRKTSATGMLTVMPDGNLITEADFSIRIEEESMNMINDLMKKKLPSIVALDSDKLGISRDIQINLKANFRPRN